MRLLRVYHLLFGERLPQGPFAGMRYIRACIGSAMWPKLLGSYEKELNPAVADVIRWQPDVIVNAGAAEGYYAVGLALRCPSAAIAAYEMVSEGRKLLGLLAEKNSVKPQVQIAEELTLAALRQQLSSAHRPAIVLDVEGAELLLLDPSACPELDKAYILLENHEVEGRSTLPEMRRRFALTHDLEEISIAPRTEADLPGALRVLARMGCKASLVRLLDEGRGAAPPWLVLRPKSSAGRA